jgi:uncharacterized phage protein (TIGR01671 family)
MKVIKFKAWDVISKKWIGAGPLEYLCVCDDIVVLVTYTANCKGGYSPNSCRQLTRKEISRLKTVQYIGLKDKNGIEIYEGDVVNLHCSGNKDHVVTATVKWVDGYARWGVPIHKKMIWHEISKKMVMMREMHSWVGEHHCFSQPRRIEVIGNIYENPELLDEKTEKI